MVITIFVAACAPGKSADIYTGIFHESAGCQKGWNNLWKAVKEDNSGARLELSFLMEQGTLIPPSVHDIKEKVRLMTILDASLLGYEAETSLGKDIVEDLPAMLKSAFKNTTPSKTKEFFQCLSDSPSPKCTEIAVIEGLIPPFEEVINRIDAAQLRGEKPRCQFRDPSAGSGPVEIIYHDKADTRKSDKTPLETEQKIKGMQ